MKVVLLEDVKGVGKMDEIKEVAEGYAKNFLFPKHLAVVALDKNIRELKERIQKQSKMAEHDLQEQQSLADRLGAMELVLKEKASEAGVLYAAVGSQKILQELTRRGVKLNKNQIENKTIKNAGESFFKIKLPHGLEAKIMVRVETL